MRKYISLLRGINVGGRNIKMADLIDCYSSIGLTNSKTFLQSGNVTFDIEEADIDLIKTNLELAVSKTFNFPARIFVLSVDKLKAIIERYPFENCDNSYQYYVIFINNILATKLYEQGVGLKSQIEDVALGDDVVYWKVQKGMTVKSPFSKLLVKSEFKDFHTNRNINTLTKLLS